ncbi:solute carrier family 23 protein [Streptomyces sp. NPDC002394]
MLVSPVESTASLLALGAATSRPTQDHTLTGSLRALDLTTVLGGVLGSFISTSYAQNVGLVALSRIRSRYVATLCGAFLVLMGLVPVLGSLVALVPLPVLGGAGVVFFFGSVAVAGIRTLAKAALGTGHNGLIVSVTLAFGLFPVATPDFYERLPAPVATVLGSGITADCLVAILLNSLLNHLGRGTEAGLDAIPAEQVTTLGGTGSLGPAPDPQAAPQPPPRGPLDGAWPAYDTDLVTHTPDTDRDPGTAAYAPSAPEGAGFPGPLHPLRNRSGHPNDPTTHGRDARSGWHRPVGAIRDACRGNAER